MDNINSKQPRKKNERLFLILTIVILGFFVGVGTGLVQFTVATIGCMGAPVAAIKLSDNDHYVLPGEYGYGPGVFKQYYCSEQMAKDAGFIPDPETKTGKAAEQTWLAEQAEIARFTPDKVTFRVYVPTAEKYKPADPHVQYMGPDNGNQVYFRLKINDDETDISVHEGKTPSIHELCQGGQDSCVIVAYDYLNRPIVKQTINHVYFSYMLKIEDTFISLEGQGASDLSLEDVRLIYHSLTEYKAGE